MRTLNGEEKKLKNLISPHKLWGLWVDIGLSLFFPLPIKQGILRTQILAVNCLGLTRIWYH